MKRQRIEWTEHFEQPLLLQAIIDVLEKSPRTKVLKAIELAQVVLPESRRHKIATLAQLPKAVRDKLIELAHVPQDWERSKRFAVAPVERAQHDEVVARCDQLALRVDELDAAFNDAQAELRTFRSAPQPPTELEHVKKFLVDVLEEVAERGRAVQGPRGTPVTAIAAALRANGRHDPAPPSTEVQRAPRVLVCGLKPHQRPPLESHFKDRARLSFWYLDFGKSGGSAFDQLRDKARGADITLLCMGAVDHQTANHVTSVTQRYERVAGGTSELQDKIETFLKQHNHEGARDGA